MQGFIASEQDRGRVVRCTVRHAQGRLGIQLITGMAEADEGVVVWERRSDPSRGILEGGVPDLAPPFWL